jgi:hypothetical protein
MSASPRRFPTLSLKLEKDSLSVRKALLFENLEAFKDKNSLLIAEEYKVQTPVPLSVLKEFVSIIEGGPITVSKENYEAFRLLSKEFGFKRLSIACEEYMGSHGHSSGESVGCDREVNPVGQVILTVGERQRTYGLLTSQKEVLRFEVDLGHVDEKGISIEGVIGSDHQVEKVVETIYSNAVAHLPDDVRKKPFLVLLLWELHSGLLHGGINGAIYCLNRLKEIAPTGFDKGLLLLLSQCDLASPDDFVPLVDADWTIIRRAIKLLRHEKNGKRKDANMVLLKLKATGRYDAGLGPWKTPQDNPGSWSESASDE